MNILYLHTQCASLDGNVGRLPATLLDCAEIPKPDQSAGRSLLSLVQGEAQDWPESVFMQISESQVGRAVRTKDWKYSVRADADGWNESSADVYYEDYLYDLRRDPHERNNLAEAPEYAEVRREQAGEKAPEIRPASQMPDHMRDRDAYRIGG